MPVSFSLSDAPFSQRATLSVVMPHSMMVNGSVITSGGAFSAGCGGCVASAAMIFRRRSISGGQWMGPMASVPTAQALP